MTPPSMWPQGGFALPYTNALSPEAARFKPQCRRYTIPEHRKGPTGRRSSSPGMKSQGVPSNHEISSTDFRPTGEMGKQG